MLRRRSTNKGYFPYVLFTTILVATSYTSTIYFVKKEVLSSRHQSKLFDIFTPTCKILHMDPFDQAILPYVNNTSVFFCSNKSQLVISNDTHLILNHQAFSDYNLTELKYPNCTYQYFWRINSKPKKEDKRIRYGPEVHFVETVKIDKEYVKVICKVRNKTIYKDCHSFVIGQPIKSSYSSVKSKKLNVVIVGMDSVSRLNFHRQMPLTNAFLHELGAIEYFGYNKVADNTFPNLIPVVSGMNVTELTTSCWHTNDDKFDNCNFIWKKYQQAGYVTALAEDAATIGLFYFLKKGFIKQPVNHMWSVFNRIAEETIGHKGTTSSLCLGVKMTLEYLNEYLLKFVRAYRRVKQNYFGIFWQTSATHDGINYGPEVDGHYRNLLKSLVLTETLEDTVLIVMSDHGMRYGDILNTYQGRLEERLPVFFIVTPKWFKKKYPEIENNLKKNARKLTTHYDLHETLKAIVNEDYSSDPINPIRGVSLFRPVPLDRTCESAGIPPHWCTCQLSEPLQIDTKLANLTANFIVNHINDMLVNHTCCAKVILDNIMYASVYKTSNFQRFIQRITYVTMVFRTKFVGAVFEATVKCKYCNYLSGFELAGSISRNNIYGHQGDCVKDAELRLYCFCKM